MLRNLECDFSPHLLPDAHGYWPILQRQFYAASPPDFYSANPWYSRAVPDPTMGTRDNPALFHNIGGNMHGGPTTFTFGYVFTGVLDGTLNPPGTYPQGAQVIVGPYGTFGTFAPCLSGGTFTIGPWGYGDAGAGCPEHIPYYAALAGQGIRYNCQLVDGQGAFIWNLQTLLAITLPQPGGQGAQREGSRVSLPGRMPTSQELNAMILRYGNRSR